MRSNYVQGLAALAGLSMGLGIASADVVTSWNDELLNSVAATPLPPPRASRAMAMVSTAVFDAVNSIDGTHQHYRYWAPNWGGSREAAAAQAARDVMVGLFPARQAIFDAKLATDLGAIAAGPAKTMGITAGQGAGARILAERAIDGATNISNYAPSNPAQVGLWQPTPPPNSAALLPQWGQVGTFSINSSTHFRPVAPPAVGSAEYAASYNEVKVLGAATGSTRTADQTSIAQAWAFGGGTITPPGAWNKIAQQLGGSNSVSENARMFAMLNVASADAAIACWDAKYFYDMWRPITAIRNGETDGNAGTTGDAAWSSLLVSPNFPTYTSGHSTFSRAAADILANFLGTDAINIMFQGDAGEVRHLTSLNGAANEAGLSRIYGGIHFDFDNIAGQECGALVANWVIANNFYAIPAPGACVLLGLGGLLAVRRRRS